MTRYYIYKLTFESGATYIGSHVERAPDNYITSSSYYKKHKNDDKLISREILLEVDDLFKMDFLESIAIISDRCNSKNNVNGNLGNWCSKHNGQFMLKKIPWNKGKKIGTTRKTPTIVCVETNEVFLTHSQADANHITKCLHGKALTSGGFHWRNITKEEAENSELRENNNKIFLENLRAPKQFIPPKQFGNKYAKDKGKKVKCLETGEVFITIRKAVEKMFNNDIKKAANISKAANKKISSAYGYHWEFVD